MKRLLLFLGALAVFAAGVSRSDSPPTISDEKAAEWIRSDLLDIKHYFATGEVWVVYEEYVDMNKNRISQNDVYKYHAAQNLGLMTVKKMAGITMQNWQQVADKFTVELTDEGLKTLKKVPGYQGWYAADWLETVSSVDIVANEAKTDGVKSFTVAMAKIGCSYTSLSREELAVSIATGRSKLVKVPECSDRAAYVFEWDAFEKQWQIKQKRISAPGLELDLSWINKIIRTSN